MSVHLDPSTATGIAGLLVVVGALGCFCGYRFFKFLLGVLGFLMGGLLLYSVSFALGNFPPVVTVTLALVGGALGAVFLVALYFVGVFVAGALLGIVVGALVSTQVSLEPIILVPVFALVLGVVSLLVQKILVVVATSVIGAAAILTGISHFLGVVTGPDWLKSPLSAGQSLAQTTWLPWCWAILALVGILVQFRQPSKDKSKKRKDS